MIADRESTSAARSLHWGAVAVLMAACVALSVVTFNNPRLAPLANLSPLYAFGLLLVAYPPKRRFGVATAIGLLLTTRLLADLGIAIKERDWSDGFYSMQWIQYLSLTVLASFGVWLRGRMTERHVFEVAGKSFLAAVAFFIVSNLAVWLVPGNESWPGYATTWSGLRDCFAMALPFFRSTLIACVAVTLVLMSGPVLDLLCRRDESDSPVSRPLTTVG